MSAVRLPPAILWGTLICGVLDITAAIINASFSGASPVRLLQFVASGLLGRDAAFAGGYATAALGLVMHFCVAFTVTAIFYALSRRFPVLVQQVIPVGLLYGAGVYLAMNVGVLPFLTWFRSLYLHTPVVFGLKTGWAWAQLIVQPQFFIHLCCVGLPIVASVAHWAPLGRTR